MNWPQAHWQLDTAQSLRRFREPPEGAVRLMAWEKGGAAPSARC
jgi:hypothetical protein